MKLTLAALALFAATPALAQTGGSDANAAPQVEAHSADASGQVKSVDAKAGTITIHHGRIAALGWPAMTMTFKAAPDVLQTAKAGQSVRFTLKTPDNEVVAIQPQ